MSNFKGTLNLSQSLFQFDENLVAPSKNFSQEFPVFMNQSKISTYFQDNPYSTLTFVNQFGMSPLGGSINYNIGSGSKPNAPMPFTMPPSNGVQNAFSNRTDSNVQPIEMNGMFVPQFMAVPIKNRNININQ